MELLRAASGHGARPLRVVHVITGLGTGGAETALLRLVETMDRQRFRNAVVSLTDEGSMGAPIAATGTPVQALGLRPGPGAILGLPGLARRLRSLRADIVQTWLYHADLMGLLAARLAGVPRVVWGLRCSRIDARHYRAGSAWVRRVLVPMSRLPDAVVANSEAGRRWHAALGYRPRRWEVIANGFDTARFRPDPDARERLRAELGVSPGQILIGLPARMDPMKDHRTFLEAAALLAASRPDARFVLIGRGTRVVDPGMPALLGDTGTRHCVLGLGERSDMPAVLAGLDVVTLSSLAEGFPNVLGEAMACGVPCVSTDVGDAAELIGDTGRIVPVRQPAAMCAVWHELIGAGEAGRQRLGLAARQRVSQHYALTATVARYQHLYAELAPCPDALRRRAPHGG